LGLPSRASRTPRQGEFLTQLIAARHPAIILNATAFSALRDDGTTVLDTADVPVLQVVLASTTREAWVSSPRGLSPADLAMNVVLPELDGRLLSRAISFKAEGALDPKLEFATARHAPCADRTEFVARQAARWAALARTPHSERRLALALSDYPARAGRAGYAVGLDTAESVAQIIQVLRGEGYDLGEREWRAADVEALLESRTDHLEIPLKTYATWLKALPPNLQNEIEAAWGDPAADPSIHTGAFSFPILSAGKLSIFLQPDRGSLHDRRNGYHDTSIPPRQRLCRALCMAARAGEDRCAHSSRYAWHAGVAAGQGAGAFGRVLARGGVGPAAGDLPVYRQQSRRSRAGRNAG